MMIGRTMNQLPVMHTVIAGAVIREFLISGPSEVNLLFMLFYLSKYVQLGIIQTLHLFVRISTTKSVFVICSLLLLSQE